MPGLILQAVRSGALEDKGAPKDVQVLPGSVEPIFPRFGFTATKKLGNAVVRNRVKRRLRETVRQIAPQKARTGYDYVLIGRKSTLKRPFSSLLNDLAIAFARVHGNSGQHRSKRRTGATRSRS